MQGPERRRAQCYPSGTDRGAVLPSVQEALPSGEEGPGLAMPAQRKEERLKCCQNNGLMMQRDSFTISFLPSLPLSFLSYLLVLGLQIKASGFSILTLHRATA